MNTTSSGFSRARATPRALSIWCISAGDLRSRNKPDARMKLRAFRFLAAAFAALGLMMLAPPSPRFPQGPPLGTLASFGVLAGSTVTNTGPSVIGTVLIPANVGVSPGSAIVGLSTFPLATPGTVHGTIYSNTAEAIQAQNSLTLAYNNLVGRTTTVDLTGQDLGGKTLVPG